MADYEKREKEVLDLLEKAIEKETAVNGVPKDKSPFNKVVKAWKDYNKDKDNNLKAIISKLSEYSDSYKAKERRSLCMTELSKAPKPADLLKKITEAYSGFPISQRKTTGAVFSGSFLLMDKVVKQEAAFYSILNGIVPRFGYYQGQVMEYAKEIATLQRRLKDKWHRTTSDSKSLHDRANKQIYDVQKMLEKSIADVRTEVKNTKDFFVKYGFKAAQKIIPLLPGMIEKIIGKVMGVQKPLEEMVSIYEKDIRMIQPTCIMFGKTREDVQEYIQKLSLDKAAGELDKLIKDAAQKAKSCPSKAQQEDAGLFITRAGYLLEGHFDEFKDINSHFMKEHKNIFLGALPPQNIEKLLYSDMFYDSLEQFTKMNIEKALQDMYEDSANTWYYNLDEATEEDRKAIKNILDYHVKELRKAVYRINEYNTKQKVQKLLEDGKKKVQSVIQ